MSKHTPGPWAVWQGSVAILIQNQADPAFPKTIASVFSHEPNGNSRLPGDANARLIAAAPDLLAACELWDQGFTDGEEFTEAQFLKWVNRNRAAARAAIAKARGE